MGAAAARSRRMGAAVGTTVDQNADDYKACTFCVRIAAHGNIDAR
jgi:hypothetical protein